MFEQFLLITLLPCVFFLGTKAASAANSQVWAWECVENKDCVKINYSSVQEPMSYNKCHLMCNNSVLWPYPTGQVSISKSVAPINPHIIYFDYFSSIKKGYNPKVQELLRLNRKIFIDGILSQLPYKISIGLTRFMSVKIDLQDPSKVDFTQETDESYSLTVTPVSNVKLNAVIKANNFFGARHGLETLSQLIVYDSFSKNVIMPTEISITDAPKYKYRGILLDTSRHFISVSAIKLTIEAMSANKLNTFHWHITDTTSFPFNSKSYPKFTMYGAYSENEIYSENDIKSIVQYGLVHGVRVMPELDTPAHVGEGWQWTPENTTVCFKAEYQQKFCVESPCGQLNPTSDDVYPILGGIYKDMSKLFRSDLFHMGGDEVNLNCWNSSANIVANMAKMNLGRSYDNFHELWSYFQKKAVAALDNANEQRKKVILWTSSLTSNNIEEYLDKSRYIIQIWTRRGDTTISHLIKKGYEVIFSNYDALFLDCGLGRWVAKGNNWCSPYKPWQTVYDNDPEEILKDLGVDWESNKHLVLGGEAALWTEQADDSSINNRLWPRGAALAERLWSSPGTWKEAKNRMAYHRGRMLRRGFSPDSIQPEWCDQNDGLCYVNYLAA